MGYTQVGLEDKILDMYPEVRSLSPWFSRTFYSWVLLSALVDNFVS
jgi:hypothetical protein